MYFVSNYQSNGAESHISTEPNLNTLYFYQKLTQRLSKLIINYYELPLLVLS